MALENAQEKKKLSLLQALTQTWLLSTRCLLQMMRQCSGSEQKESKALPFPTQELLVPQVSQMGTCT